MNINNSKMYLCKADHSFLGTITGIKAETCILIKNVTDLWELTFEVDKYIENNGQLIQSDYYDSIDEMMRLYFDSDNIQAFFMIDSEPVITGDSYQEIKKVTAHSIECELCNMFLQNLKINCGTPDSQEYLATDKNNNPSNIYKGLPVEYVSLVNYNNPQLSLLHLVLQNTGWSVKENIPSDICNLKGSFETSESIYSFLMKTVSSAFSIIFEFDRKNRQVSFVKASDYGKDTGIFIGMRNLMNSIEITSSSSDAIMTKIIPTGANNLGIEQVNFSKDYILNLDYFMDTLNEYGDYKFVSKDLHAKYNLWKNYRDIEKVIYNSKEYTRRELYSELSKLYNQSVAIISELKNRVPNDGCMIDYTKFSLEELKQSLTAYKNALNALITCYKDDIIEEYNLSKDTIISINDNFTLTFNPQPSFPISPVSLPDSVYWYDYYAYKEKIIPQITETLKIYCETDENGNLVVDENGNYVELEHGNQKYYANTNIVHNIDSYLYEWSLYGLDELEAKKKSWSEAANLLFKKCFIASGTIDNPIYRTPNDSGWNSLNKDEKLEFTTKTAFFNQLNQYLDYMSLDEERDNSLTGIKGKGIIRQCIDAIEERKQEIATETEKQNSFNIRRAELANSVTLENFTVNDTLLFSEKDLHIIQSMIRTNYYNNDYILTTNLDDVVSIVDRQEELYKSALEELYKISQPQYSFKTELDNLYALDEFREYQESFDIGNFIRVGLEIHEELYDNEFVKLRLISISYNPFEISEQLSIEFSTITKSLNSMDDLDFLLNNISSSSRSGTTSSSSSGGGTYGNNDANVQISNNMLNALLSTEMFGTAVSDVLLDTIKANKGDFNTLISNSGIFKSLETGQIKVNGNCLFDGNIQSSNFSLPDNSTIGSGSCFNLSNGTFESYASNNNYIKNDGKNLIIKMDNFSVDENGNAKFSGYVDGGKININDKFLVDEEGNVISEGTLDIKKTGTIAGWSFNEKGFYRNSDIIGNAGGKYIGDDGFSIDNRFIINNNGIYIKNKNYIKDNIGNFFFVFSKNPYSPKNVYGGSTTDIPLTIYFYGYEDFENDQEFSLFFYSDNVECTIYASEIVNSERVTSCATYQYRFHKSDIKIGNSNIPDIFKHYIDTSKIGYITLSDMKFVTSDLEDNIKKDYPEYYITNVIERAINSFYGVYTSLPENANINHIWNTNYEPLKMICIYYAYSNDNSSISGYETQYISMSDYTPISMLFDATSLEFGTSLTTKISTTGLKSSYIYNNVSVSGSELYISSDGTIGLSGSSKRFKNSISTTLSNISDPHGLYDINIVQYKYNDDYFFSENDRGIGKYFIGFIAEDVEEKFKDGVTYDNKGLVNGWSIRSMFPAALKLIQEQHEEIESLKNEVNLLKQK